SPPATRATRCTSSDGAALVRSSSRGGRSHAPHRRRASAASGVRKVGASTGGSGPALPAVAGRGRAPQHARADEVALDLDGAGTDAQSPDVSVDALDRVLTREAVAAEQLDRLVAYELGGEVGRGLRHRSL